MELTDQDYGSRDFAVRDLEGNQWNFGNLRAGMTIDIKRIHPYVEAAETAVARDFYVDVLGMRVAMEEPVLNLGRRRTRRPS